MILPRLNQIRKILTEQQAEAFLIEDPINLFYFTGHRVSTGQLVVEQEKASFYLDQRYFEKCQDTPGMIVKQMERYPLKERLKAFKKICFDSETVTHGRVLELKNSADFYPLPHICKILRMIKDSQEITFLKSAGQLGAQGFDYVCSLLQEGMTEAEVALELEIFWKKRRSQGVAFEPIIAFGANSSMPHYRAGEAKLKKRDPVLIDIGVLYQNYHSDMTRVLFYGDVHPEIQKIYRIVQEAQQEALKRCQPGFLIGDLDKIAREVIASYGYAEKFTHSLGHGVGLEIHEYPSINQKSLFAETPLQSGMVLTIEPGIYLPGIGGVRLEDTVVITDSFHENLTNRPLDPVFIP